MKLHFTLLATLFSFVASSQDDFIVTNKLDTLYGKIGFLNLSDDVSLKTENDRITYQPYQLSFVYFENDSYKPIVYNNARVLAKEVIKGSLSLYLVRPEDGNEFSTEILLKKKGDILLIPRIGFKKYVTDFLAECQEIASKIENGTYKFGDLNTIIEQYNTQCSSLNTEPEATAQLKDLQLLLSDIYSKLDKKEPIPAYLKRP